MEARLEILAKWSGRVWRDASFVPALAMALNPAEQERYRVDRQVYLSRYARISVTEQEGMTAARLNTYVQAVSALLKRESASSQQSEDNYI